MLQGVHPLLTGAVLLHLDAMGHSDSVAVVDAHFPAARVGRVVIDMPGTTSPHVLAAIRSVLPPDDTPALDLMATADATVLPVQEELAQAAGVTHAEVRYVDRLGFYELVEGAQLVVRTGETRVYGNALFRKGLVTPAGAGGAQ
ncbi:transport protein RbsD/FucU [Terrabacter sp. 28]|nr:transport protein RbsD/FucU [Terrabacter sp. 28]